MKKILILCPSPYGTNPGQRLKYEQYINHWKENGYKVVISSFQTQRFWDIIYKEGHLIEKVFWTIWGYLRRIRDLFRIPFYDGLYVFMAITPFGPPIFESIVCKLNPNIVFDVEDMAFMPNVSAANKWISKLKGYKKYIYLAKKAKFVITSAPGLSKEVLKYNKNVQHITATFDMDRFQSTKTYNRNKIPVIGWTGSHSTIKYLSLLDNVFKELAKKRKFKLLVISNSKYENKHIDVENIPWQLDTEIDDLHRIDIGVYPVPMEKWVLGKSGCKTITYMSVALPSVSTAYGNVLENIVEHGENGFLAYNEDEWVENLTQLIDDVALREKMGKAAKQKAVEFFSVQANLKVYLSAFNIAFDK